MTSNRSNNPVVYTIAEDGVRHYPIDPAARRVRTFCDDGTRDWLYHHVITLHGPTGEASLSEAELRHSTAVVCRTCLQRLERTFLMVRVPDDPLPGDVRDPDGPQGD